MKICVFLLASSALIAQSNSIQLCDQQATRHCLTIKAPSSMPLSPSPVVFSGNSGALLVGMASTDISVLPGAIVSADSFISASATTNASIISMAATPSSGGADISVGKTGTGALLALRFFRNPQEVAEFDVNNRLLVGLTSSDVGSGLGSIIAADSFVSASAPLNASLLSLVANGFGAFISSGATGTGTVQPLIFFRNPNEVARFDTSNRFLLGMNADNGSGALLQVHGDAVPGVDDTYDLGTASFRWHTIRTDNLFISGTCVGCTAIAPGVSGDIPFNNGAGAFDVDSTIFFYDKPSHTANGTIFKASTGFVSLNSASNTVNIPNGGLLALNATIGSISNYTIYQGISPQIDATNLGGAFEINGSGVTNGNIVMNPGNVAGAASLFVNTVRSDWPSLIVKTKSGVTTSDLVQFQDSGGVAQFRVVGLGASVNGGSLFVGLPTTDAGFSGPSILAQDAVGSISSTSNASLITMAATLSGAAGPGADLSSGATGTGTVQPLRFFRNPNELARFASTNQFLVGLKSTDVSSGIGSIVVSNNFVSATAILNASVGSFAAVAGSYVAIASSTTGTGTMLPMTFFTNNLERMRIRVDGVILSGLTSTDVSVLPGAIVSADSFVSATATTNASTASFVASAGNYAAFASSRTGSGTFLPMTFFTNSAERLRIRVDGVILSGLASTDVSVLAGAIVSANSIVSATATANASVGSFAAVASTYVAFASSTSGSGTMLPMTFFTNNSERMRILVNGQVLINRTTDDGTGAQFEVNGAISVSSCTGCGGVTTLAATAPITVSASTGAVTIACANCDTLNTNQTITSQKVFSNASQPIEVNQGATTSAIGIRVGNSSSNIDISGGDGSKTWINSQSWAVVLRTGGTDRLTVTTGGSVCVACSSTAFTFDVTGTLHASTSLNGPSFIGGTFSGTTYTGTSFTAGSTVILQGSGANIDATALSGAFNFNGATSVNGNFVFNPGNVTGLSSVQINGHNNSSVLTETLILNEVTGLGAGITFKHGGSFDATWQAGGSGSTATSLNVVNASSVNNLVVFQNGHVWFPGGGSSPSVTGGECTGASISGTDEKGTISCTAFNSANGVITINFGNTWFSNPVCVFNAWFPGLGAGSVFAAAPTSTATTFVQLTTSFSGSTTSTASINYLCIE